MATNETLSNNARKAILLSKDKKALRKRLLGAKQVLAQQYKREFSSPVFDFKNKRLVSTDGSYALQWRLRGFPNRPESADNQQTNVGAVVLVSFGKKHFGNISGKSRKPESPIDIYGWPGVEYAGGTANPMRESSEELLNAVKSYFDTDDVLFGKGGFFVRGKGFISMRKARSLTKVEAPKREPKGRILPWGDYATVAMFNQPRRKKNKNPRTKARPATGKSVNPKPTKATEGVGEAIVWNGIPLGPREISFVANANLEEPSTNAPLAKVKQVEEAYWQARREDGQVMPREAKNKQGVATRQSVRKWINSLDEDEARLLYGALQQGIEKVKAAYPTRFSAPQVHTNPKRPPKKWFNKMKHKIQREYPNRSPEDVDKIVGGIWYNQYSPEARKGLLKQESNPLGVCPRCGRRLPLRGGTVMCPCGASLKVPRKAKGRRNPGTQGHWRMLEPGTTHEKAVARIQREKKNRPHDVFRINFYRDPKFGIGVYVPEVWYPESNPTTAKGQSNPKGSKNPKNRNFFLNSGPDYYHRSLNVQVFKTEADARTAVAALPKGSRWKLEVNEYSGEWDEGQTYTIDEGPKRGPDPAQESYDRATAYLAEHPPQLSPETQRMVDYLRGQSNPKPNPKIISKYPGRCKKCGQPIKVGEQIDWERGRGASHVTCPERSKQAATAGHITVSIGSPRQRNWQAGQVVRNRQANIDRGQPEWLYILDVNSRYYSEDGMSFGVGDESGYVYTLACRKATDEESAALRAKRGEKDRRLQAINELKDIAKDVQNRGEKPEGQHKPEGEVVAIKPQDIYGGGDWFVIGTEYVWYVRNNGMDGDDWSRNNVITGGAGAIGWRIKDAAIANRIRNAARNIKEANPKLPERKWDTLSGAIGMSSPSGSMSKRAKAEASERLRKELFGEGLPFPTTTQPSEAESLRRTARELRDLAQRGMKPRAYKREADKLEAKAAELELEQSHNPKNKAKDTRSKSKGRRNPRMAKYTVWLTLRNQRNAVPVEVEASDKYSAEAKAKSIFFGEGPKVQQVKRTKQ